ncbi:MAG: lipid-A-disaccharide synthase N-terminal domain-containing protein, partial [Phycisphaerales bacterium]|nr:lipid-A-disaccharide synthase N-terminal domain-containing protein [Phycisphaerales bacterium]
LLFRGQPPSAVMSRAELERVLPPKIVQGAIDSRGNWFYRKLNVTSWVGVAWVAIGLVGQLLFSGRMVLQWLVSEKHSKSVITESFWWFSLSGGLILFSYFIWRQDPVAMLGQASGIVIYSRNIRLIHKTKRRARRAATLAEPANPESPAAA